MWNHRHLTYVLVRHNYGANALNQMLDMPVTWIILILTITSYSRNNFLFNNVLKILFGRLL